VTARLARKLSQVREACRTWLRLAAVLPRAGYPLLIVAVVVSVVRGLLPVTFIVSVAHVLYNLSRDTGTGGGVLSAAGAGLVVALVAFGLQQLLAAPQAALTFLIGRRLDGAGISDLMSTVIRAPVARVERQDTINALTGATVNLLYGGFTPGGASAALLPLATRYLDLAAAVVVLGVVISWPVAILLGVAALSIRFAQRGSRGRFSQLWTGLAGERQRIYYLRTIGTNSSSAQEMRALRLTPWLTQRHERDNRGYFRPLWSGRRSIFLLPFIGYSVFGYLTAGFAFAVIAWQASGPARLLSLAIAVQAVLVPLRFGSYFPECDTATQYGAQTARDLEKLHEDLATPADTASRVTIGLTGPPTVRFDDVTFTYLGGDSAVLDGLNLTLPAGRSTAVVGVNGAGKTTLVKQLCGLYLPDHGRVTVDGQDLAGADLAGWRRQIAVILQDFVRYESTVRDNVLFGAAGHPEDADAMHDAIDRAGAREIVDALPNGMSTILSPAYEGGVGLSGGQWQRLALARALYAVNLGARLLVLDEPTAQLDVRSEAAFFERFMQLTEGLTTLVISHRFSTVRRADGIAVLSGGRVTEYGRHEELLAAGGTYAAMFRLQADRFTAGAVPAAAGAQSDERSA
jgi:ATP-binding cassette subfamily B protein